MDGRIEKLLFFSALPFLTTSIQAAQFMPEKESHPIVAGIKIAGMIATAIFVGVMLYKSIRIVKDDEDDSVHLPD
ncbi:hypothetical protein [Hydrogenimonas sp.]